MARPNRTARGDCAVFKRDNQHGPGHFTPARSCSLSLELALPQRLHLEYEEPAIRIQEIERVPLVGHTRQSAGYIT